MSIDVDEELLKVEEDVNTAASALRKTGFTQEQLEQLEKFVYALIAHSQYSIIKAKRAISSESAMSPGEFQSKVL